MFYLKAGILAWIFRVAFAARLFMAPIGVFDIIGIAAPVLALDLVLSWKLARAKGALSKQSEWRTMELEGGGRR